MGVIHDAPVTLLHAAPWGWHLAVVSELQQRISYISCLRQCFEYFESRKCMQQQLYKPPGLCTHTSITAPPCIQEADGNIARIVAAMAALHGAASVDGPITSSPSCSLLLVVDNAEDALRHAEAAKALRSLLQVGSSNRLH